VPCALGDEAVVKIYKGSRFKKIKYRVVWFGRVCAQVMNCYDGTWRRITATRCIVFLGITHDFSPRHE
jgi:hypothetical protein